MDAAPTEGEIPVATEEAAPPATPVLAAVIATRARGVPPGGVVEVRLRLDPPSLGEVGVRIRAGDGGLQVHLMFETAEAASFLSGEQARLREGLARCGLALDSFSTSVRDSLRAATEEQGEGGGRGSAAGPSGHGREGDGARGRRGEEAILAVSPSRPWQRTPACVYALRLLPSPSVARLDARV